MDKINVQKSPTNTGKQNASLTKTPASKTSKTNSQQQPVFNNNSFKTLGAFNQLSPAHLLHLQRTVGNQAVGRILQAKLTISHPDDPYECEADQVADKVMRMPEPVAEGEEESAVQTKPLAGRITQLVYRQQEAIEEEQQPVQAKQEESPEQEEKTVVAAKPLQQKKEEKPVQAKSATESFFHRQAKEDEEKEETPPAAPMIHREMEKEKEEQIQAKLFAESALKAPMVRPSIFQSASPTIQRLCPECAEEKRQEEGKPGIAQRKQARYQLHDDNNEEEQRVQSKGARIPTPQVTPTVAANIHALNHGGTPLPKATRAFFEPRFGVDLSQVRVHKSPQASETAKSINARAFTVGNNIVFGGGQFAPESSEGRRLLAHELTHTVQQGAASISPSVSTPHYPNISGQNQRLTSSVVWPNIIGSDAISQQHYSERRRLLAHVVQGYDAASTDRVKRQPAPASDTGQQQGGQTGQQAAALDPASKDLLAKSGLVTSAADESELAKGFPDGFIVGPPTPLVLSLDFGNRLDGVRVQVFRLTPARPPQPGVEAWFFQIGKGRSILVSSIGGGSVLLDAGTGQTSSINARSVQQLNSAIGAVTSGPAAVPQTIKLSHADTDHYNAVRPVLTRAEFTSTAVEVARQQIEGSGAWARYSLTVQPTQRLIQIDVTGTSGVHVQRTVIDNMELTEYRSVAAQSDLGRTDKVTFDRNRTSPIVVVRDLNTGNRMLFTADAEGRQGDEIVSAVGDTGMRRLLGAEGHNLKVMEGPHHFGEQAAGPNARGMINMLQLAYESGEGSLRLVAQTTQNFATKPSSTYNFLDASGTAPERIENDPSGAGRAQATRAQGSTLARVTVDLAGVQQAIQELQSRDTPLRQAYTRLAELDGMQARLTAMRSGLGGTAPTPITSSLITSEADVTRMRTDLRAATQAVWDAMRAAAAPEGMRNAADMTAVNAALGQLATRVTATGADATRVGNGIGALAEGLRVYARLSTNSVRIIQALDADNVTELYAARAEHTDLVRAARAELGGNVVDEHIRKAWKAVQAEWPVEKFEARTAEMSARVAARERSAEFLAVLGEGLARQMELNKVVAEAEHAGRKVYGPGGTPMTPMSTRVGAGVMAAIEVVRIGLDIAVQWKAGSDAAELREARTAYQGIAIMNWWQRLGVTPTLALAEQSSWNNSKLNIVLRDPQDKVRQAAISGDSPIKDVPDFTAVVVTGLDADGLRKLIHRAIAELSTLEDWYAFTTGFPGGEAFKAFDGLIWGVRVFIEEQRTYGYVRVDDIAPGLNLEIIRLHGELVKAQENAFAADQKGGKAGYGVKDTAWILGQDRSVVIYTRFGNPETIDFDSDRPRFQKVATVAYPWWVKGPMVKVKAADMMTYYTLLKYFWVEGTGNQYIDETGTHEYVDFGPNVHGYAYVDPNNLIQRDV